MSDNTFVAIRKSSNDSLALQATSIGERRAQLIEEARHSDRADELIRIGFTPAPPSSALATKGYGYEPMPEDVPKFRRMGNIDAYYVAAPNDEKKQKALDVFEGEYLIVPDIRLSIPSATRGESSAELVQHRWPEISGIQDAHAKGIRGAGVRVGVLDTGCDADHMQFENKTIDFLYVNPTNLKSSKKRRAFDVDNHGTHVCGIIAGKQVGVAPEAELLVASVIESERTETSLDRILFALDWMLSTFDERENQTKPLIINMSLGFRTDLLKRGIRQRINTAMKSILTRMLVDFQVLTIAAMGNDGASFVNAPGYFGDVIGVGAVDGDLNPAAFSGGGRSPDNKRMKPDIVGFGVDIYSALERDAHDRSFYGTMSGTSMAAPYVTGIAALYASMPNSPRIHGLALRDRLLQNALELPSHPKNRVGAGLARFK
jgi:serine protease AprX